MEDTAPAQIKEQVEQNEGEDEEDDKETTHKKSHITRFFDEDDKTIICRNWGEVGHIARKWPNDLKVKCCSLWGQQSHDQRKEAWPFVLCFSCNKGGHTIKEWNPKNIINWSKWNMNGKF